jgi:hypothetical protein
MGVDSFALEFSNRLRWKPIAGRQNGESISLSNALGRVENRDYYISSNRSMIKRKDPSNGSNDLHDIDSTCPNSGRQ